jgi:hypothetical protein
VPELLLLHGAIARTDALGRSEAARLRQRTEYWLRESLQRLKRRQSAIARQQRENSRSLPRTDAVAVAGGAEEARNVQQLIDLIESTIEPESWDVNGGPGTIRYYSPLHVLVIRNSQRVHEQIGGVRRDLE